MSTTPFQRQQVASGIEQLAALARAQSRRPEDGVPALPPAHSAVLRMLEGARPGMRAKAIAARLGVTPASVSDTLATLETRGWIERRPDPDDGRAALVRLTRAGRRLAERLRSPLHGIGALLEGLDEPDLAALLRATQLLVHEAQKRGMATGARTCLGCRHFRPFATGHRDKPHFCAFIQLPFGDAELRADCPEQAPAPDIELAGNALRFRQALPP
ncbi:MarR family transcriptional regulator [Luteimonas marina]|uniref:MarR family transcriptional regulator n=1 Tax=Luteimonas marina TaxID=488485 RepID=A0A5C5U2V0_9GAMM|nr:MarR family transcriptional regulator [Luteimonas marina]TWT20234.1 MarR family transcriptional regulator [Luteimonas marina]